MVFTSADRNTIETARSPARFSLSALSSPAALAYFVFAMFVVGADITYIALNFPKLPFGDHWIWLAVVLQKGPLAALYQQYNEHRLTVPGLAYLADFYWFHGTNRFLLAVSMLLQMGCIVLLAAPLWQLRAIPKPVRYVFAGMVAILLFWFIQGESFFLTFSLCMACANAGILASLYLFSRLASRDPKSHPHLLLAGVIFFAFWANYSYGHGILVWPVLLAMCVLMRLPRRYFLIIGAGFVTAVAIYFYHYERPAISAAAPTPVRMLRYIVLMLGLPFIGPGAEPVVFSEHVGSYLLSIAGILAAAGLLARFALVRREHENGEQVFYCSLLMLSLGSVLLTAWNRSGRFPAEQALSGRYAPVPLLFWISLAALITVYLSRLETAAGFGRAIWCVLLIFASLATLSGQKKPGIYLARLNRTQAAAAMSISVGVPDIPQIKANLQEASDFVFYVDRMERAQLGRSYFDPPERAWIGTPLQQHFQLAAAGACQGAVDSSVPLPKPAVSGIKVSGWAWDVKGHRPAELLFVTDEGSIIRGLGVSHMPRPDVAAAHSDPNMESTGWVAYAQAPADSRPLTVFSELSDGKAVCQIGTSR